MEVVWPVVLDCSEAGFSYLPYEVSYHFMKAYLRTLWTYILIFIEEVEEKRLA